MVGLRRPPEPEQPRRPARLWLPGHGERHRRRPQPDQPGWANAPSNQPDPVWLPNNARQWVELAFAKGAAAGTDTRLSPVAPALAASATGKAERLLAFLAGNPAASGLRAGDRSQPSRGLTSPL
jgi:hypothetical protein